MGGVLRLRSEMGLALSVQAQVSGDKERVLPRMDVQLLT